MKDKFLDIIGEATIGLFKESEAAEKCEQIADEYAEGFAEWIAENVFDYTEDIYGLKLQKGEWVLVKNKKHILTTKQLLELYKQSLKTTI